MTERDDGLVETTEAYMTIVDGRIVIIHDVPMLLDPDTQEKLMTPETAARLFELLSQQEQKTGVVTSDVYSMEN